MRKIGYLILVLLTLYVSIMYDGDAGMFLLAFELMLAVFLYLVFQIPCEGRALCADPRCREGKGVSGGTSDY